MSHSLLTSDPLTSDLCPQLHGGIQQSGEAEGQIAGGQLVLSDSQVNPSPPHLGRGAGTTALSDDVTAGGEGLLTIVTALLFLLRRRPSRGRTSSPTPTIWYCIVIFQEASDYC